MGFLASKLFWGGLLIFWGLMLVLEKLLQVNIPFMRFLIAFLLIYCGIYLLMRHNKPKKVFPHTNIFTEVVINADGTGKEYSVIFGSQVVDLSDITDYNQTISINTIFGSTVVYLSKNQTYRVSVNTVFGPTEMPDKQSNSFGSREFILGDKEVVNKIPIEINTIFGSTAVVFKE